MNNYNPHIHHRRSIRMKGYDYSQAGLYFITIVCNNRAQLFGDIEAGQMILNKNGLHTKKCWLEIPEHFPNIILHEYIIMPNHIHGIIEIVGANKYSPNENSSNINSPNENSSNENSPNINPHNENSSPNHSNIVVGKNDSSEIDTENIFYENGATDIGATDIGTTDIGATDIGAKNISPLRSPSKTIGSVVRGFKIGVTKYFRSNTLIFDVWQRNYYEHIIRDEKSFGNISEYIVNNPLKWHEDKFYIN